MEKLLFRKRSLTTFFAIMIMAFAGFCFYPEVGFAGALKVTKGTIFPKVKSNNVSFKGAIKSPLINFKKNNVTISLEDYSQTLNGNKFKKKGKKYIYKASKRSAGLKNVVIDFKKKTFVIKGNKINLSNITNPVSLEIEIGNQFRECTGVKMKKRNKGKKWIFSGKNNVACDTDQKPTIFISSPTSEDSTTTNKSMVDLAGTASDDVGISKINWVSSSGGNGSATGTTDWVITDVALVEGDNVITVTVTDTNKRKTSDSLLVTYNSNIEFLSTLQSNPGSIFVGDATSITFTLAIGNSTGLDTSSIKLHRLTSENTISETLTTLADDGNLFTGDDIASDGVFHGVKTVTENEEGVFRVRVSVDSMVTSTLITDTETVVTSTVTSYSDILDVPVVAHLTDTEFETAISLPIQAETQYDTFAEKFNKTKTQKKTVNWLESQDNVLQAGISESGEGIWYVLDSGIAGGLMLNPDGTRGSVRNQKQLANNHLGPKKVNYISKKGSYKTSAEKNGSYRQQAESTKPSIGSNSVLIIGPFNTEFGTTSEGGDLETLFGNATCPSYKVTKEYDASANVSAFKTLSNYGIVSVISHGDTYYSTLSKLYKKLFGWDVIGPQVIILTGEKATTATKKTYESDLKNGRLVIISGYYAVTPSFISFYNKSFPDSIIHAGSCRSMFNDTMANAFIGNGAKTYTGYSEYVASSYAKKTIIKYWTSMVDDGSTAGQAFAASIAAFGSNDGSSSPAFFRQRGNSEMTLNSEGIVNGDFEEGNLNGWGGQGDVRIISMLGPLTPQDGTYMSIISTGLGSVSESDSVISQTFCVPAGVSTLSFKYDVISEEPLEFVGTQFDDQFETTLTSSSGTTNLAQESINSSSWLAVGGIDFAGGDDTTFHTGWKTVTYDVSSYAGKGTELILIFRTFDAGDSIYDTAAILDSVKLE